MFIELNGVLKDNEQAGFRRKLCLCVDHIVAVYAPNGARNLSCNILTSAGVVYEVQEGYDAVTKRLLALPGAPKE